MHRIMKQCTAHVFVFSGRPDPTWLVEEQHSKRLEEIWNQLTPSVAQGDVRQRLGYRGVTMACEGDKEYTVLIIEKNKIIVFSQLY